jgi:hypothetical protein
VFSVSSDWLTACGFAPSLVAAKSQRHSQREKQGRKVEWRFRDRVVTGAGFVGQANAIPPKSGLHDRGSNSSGSIFNTDTAGTPTGFRLYSFGTISVVWIEA